MTIVGGIRQVLFPGRAHIEAGDEHAPGGSQQGEGEDQAAAPAKSIAQGEQQRAVDAF